jgi:hypothetical protein
MAESICFSKRQYFLVGEALRQAEGLAEDYFGVNLKDCRRFPYDLRTLANLKGQEKTRRALAQVCKYQYEERISPAPIARKEFYRICLQDNQILQTTRNDPPLLLRPLLLYIITHELIHVVRFSMEPQKFHLDAEKRRPEEEFVHRATHEILQSTHYPQMKYILERYRWCWEGLGSDWGRPQNLDNSRW